MSELPIHPNARVDMTKETNKNKMDDIYVKNPYATDPNKKSQLPMYINLALHTVARYCPHCGYDVQDKRFKRRMTGPSLFTRRFTDFSITRECRCGFRFNFTWKTFVNVMKKQLKTERAPQMRVCLETWIMMIETYFGLNEWTQLDKIEALRQRSRKTK